MKTKSTLWALFAAALLAACGNPDSSALLTSEMPGGDEELSETTGELSNNTARFWFPMDEGNEWKLQSATGATHVIRVEYREGNIAWVSGLTRDDGWFGYSTQYPNNLYAWSEANEAWGYHTRFGYQYTPWTTADATSSTCYTYDARRESTDVSVTTPAGTFANARVISFSARTSPNAFCAQKLGPRFVTFAPGVGPVSVTIGGEKFELVSAKVGSKSYPLATGLVTQVSADKSAYLNQANTIRCITTPCPSNEVTAKAVFTFKITNKTGGSKKFTFASGKQFDFELLDANGKVVRAWSDDRVFTQALTSFTLANGATRTFTGELELKDRDGLQLDGTYTVRATLWTSGSAARPMAQSSFSVTIAE